VDLLLVWGLSRDYANFRLPFFQWSQASSVSKAGNSQPEAVFKSEKELKTKP